MVDLKDAMNLEGEAESEEEYFASIQRYINAGCWSGPGREGRAMMEAIEAGRCMLGPKLARDYYGNVIPARDMVKAGTKGSYQFVADRFGTDWADQMKEV